MKCCALAFPPPPPPRGAYQTQSFCLININRLYTVILLVESGVAFKSKKRIFIERESQRQGGAGGGEAIGGARSDGGAMVGRVACRSTFQPRVGWRRVGRRCGGRSGASRLGALRSAARRSVAWPGASADRRRVRRTRAAPVGRRRASQSAARRSSARRSSTRRSTRPTLCTAEGTPLPVSAHAHMKKKDRAGWGRWGA